MTSSNHPNPTVAESSEIDQESIRSEILQFTATEDDKERFFDALKEVDDSHLKDLMANLQESSEDDLTDTYELLKGLKVEDDRLTKNLQSADEDYSFSFETVTDVRNQKFSSNNVETESASQIHLLGSDFESSRDFDDKSLHLLSPEKKAGTHASNFYVSR
jgi:hypothetical protein